MDKKVPMYKYYFSEEYKNVHYKTLKDRGRKYTLKRELAYIDSTIGLVAFTYAMVAYSGAFYNIMMNYLTMEGSMTSITKEDGLLIALIPTGVVFLCHLMSNSPAEYKDNYSEFYDSFFLGGIYDNYFSATILHISFSACIGLFTEELIGYLNGDNSLITGSSSTGFMIGGVYGIITSVIGTKNLKKMDLDSEEKESRLELYPGMMLVNEIEPVMTMNLAYRF